MGKGKQTSTKVGAKAGELLSEGLRELDAAAATTRYWFWKYRQLHSKVTKLIRSVAGSALSQVGRPRKAAKTRKRKPARRKGTGRHVAAALLFTMLSAAGLAYAQTGPPQATFRVTAPAAPLPAGQTIVAVKVCYALLVSGPWAVCLEKSVPPWPADVTFSDIAGCSPIWGWAVAKSGAGLYSNIPVLTERADYPVRDVVASTGKGRSCADYPPALGAVSRPDLP